MGCKMKMKRSVDKCKTVCLKENSPSFTFEMTGPELVLRSKTHTDAVMDSSMETSAQCSVVIKTPDQVSEIPRKERIKAENVVMALYNAWITCTLNSVHHWGPPLKKGLYQIR